MDFGSETLLPCLRDAFVESSFPRTDGSVEKILRLMKEEGLILIQEARDTWYSGIDEAEYQISDDDREYEILPRAKAFEYYRDYKLPRHKRWLRLAAPDMRSAIISAVVGGSVSLLITQLSARCLPSP